MFFRIRYINKKKLFFSDVCNMHPNGYFFGEYSRLVDPIRLGSILNQFKIDQSKISLFFSALATHFYINIEKKYFLLLYRKIHAEIFYLFFFSQQIYIFLLQLGITFKDVMWSWKKNFTVPTWTNNFKVTQNSNNRLPNRFDKAQNCDFLQIYSVLIMT